MRQPTKFTLIASALVLFSWNANATNFRPTCHTPPQGKGGEFGKDRSNNTDNSGGSSNGVSSGSSGSIGTGGGAVLPGNNGTNGMNDGMSNGNSGMPSTGGNSNAGNGNSDVVLPGANGGHDQVSGSTGNGTDVIVGGTQGAVPESARARGAYLDARRLNSLLKKYPNSCKSSANGVTCVLADGRTKSFTKISPVVSNKVSSKSSANPYDSYVAYNNATIMKTQNVGQAAFVDSKSRGPASIDVPSKLPASFDGSGAAR